MLCLCGLTAGQLSKEEMEQVTKECLQQTPYTSDDVTKFQNGQITQNIKCFFKCSWEKMGVIKDGILVQSKAHAKCRSVTGTDPCDLAYNYNTCLGPYAKN